MKSFLFRFTNIFFIISVNHNPTACSWIPTRWLCQTCKTRLTEWHNGKLDYIEVTNLLWVKTMKKYEVGLRTKKCFNSVVYRPTFTRHISHFWSSL